MVREYFNSGPYEIPTNRTARGGKILDLETKSLTEFWKMVETDQEGVSSACGCYVYAIRAGRGLTPWYVGQAKEKFKKEVFNPSNKTKFITHYSKVKHGTPVIFLISRLVPKGNKWKKKLEEPEANWVEDYLIGLGLSVNKELLNIQKTKLYKEVILPGIYNSKPGQPTQPTRDLAKAFDQ